MKGSTWRVIEWPDRPEDAPCAVAIHCACGVEADVPCGQLVGGSLAAVTSDNSILFEPPWLEPSRNWIPSVIECRSCGRRLMFETIEPS